MHWSRLPVVLRALQHLLVISASVNAVFTMTRLKALGNMLVQVVLYHWEVPVCHACHHMVAFGHPILVG